MRTEPSEFPDHYATLGVPVDADANAIRRAFRVRVKEVHPDVASNKVEANENFIRLKEAYSILSDPEQRTTYDLRRANHRSRQKERERAAEVAREQARRASSRHTGGPADSQGTGGYGSGGYGSYGTGSAPWDMGPGNTSRRMGPKDTWDQYQESLSVPELLKRAMGEIASGRYSHARKDLADILAREPQNPEALVLMGRLYQAEGRTDEWIRVLEEGVRKNPGHAALRLALNEARRAAVEQNLPPIITEEDKENRRRACMAGGIIAAALSMGWGLWRVMNGQGTPFVLSALVPVLSPLMTGAMFCAFFTGWTMAATGFITPVDENLFYPDTQGRSLSQKRSRNDAPLGLAVPGMALIHYSLAVAVMLMLMLSRSAVSRSLLVVTGTAFGLALAMVLAEPKAAGSIMMWCPGWLLFAEFVGWFLGDLFR